MSKLTIDDLGQVIIDIYQPPADRGTGDWSSSPLPGDHPGSGLKIDTYTNQKFSNTHIIGIGGTDGFFDRDWIANIGISGAYIPEQFKKALEYVAEQLDAANKITDDSNPGTEAPNFVVAGHSLGAAEAQIIAKVFNLPGMGLDGPGAGAIFKHPEFETLIDGLKARHPNAFNHQNSDGSTFEDFVNAHVDNSAVSSLGGEHLGTEMTIDDQSELGKVAAVLMTSGSAAPAGLLLAFYDQLSKHDKENALNALKEKYGDISLEEMREKYQQELEDNPPQEKHTDTANLVGAGTSAAFTSYAQMVGWTEEAWMDEPWEQSVASHTVTEVAKDIADWNFEAADYNVLDWDNTGGSMAASLAANAIGDELGLGGEDAASTVGSSMAISGMSYTIESLSTTTTSFSVEAAGATQGAPSLLGSMANAGAGALGSWAASQVLHSNSAEEAIGSAIGGAVGGMLGSAVLPPLGTMVGSYLGSVVGDSYGESYNTLKEEVFDDGFQLNDIVAVGLELGINAPMDAIRGVFGMDKKPPPPEAYVEYKFNPLTEKYELADHHERHGGNTSSLRPTADNISEQLQQLINNLGGQLANRYSLPEFKLGYEGKNTFVEVNGFRVGSLDSKGIKTMMGEVLSEVIVESDHVQTNRLLSVDVEPQELLALVSETAPNQLINYFTDEAYKESTDLRLAPQSEMFESYGKQLNQQQHLQQQIQHIKDSAYTETSTDAQGNETRFTVQPQSTQLKQLEQQLSELETAIQQTYEDYLDSQIEAVEQQIDQAQSAGHSSSDLEELLQNLRIAKQQSPMSAPQELIADFELHSMIEKIHSGDSVFGLNAQDLHDLSQPNPLDSATRIDYEIRQHNRLQSLQNESTESLSNNDQLSNDYHNNHQNNHHMGNSDVSSTTQNPNTFSLFNTDLTNLVFTQQGDSLTIYNRTGYGLDTPLAALPKLTLADFNAVNQQGESVWTDSTLNLNFINEGGEEVSTEFNLKQLLATFADRADSSDDEQVFDQIFDQIFDMASIVAQIYTEHSGVEMTTEQAFELQFGGFGKEVQSNMGSGKIGSDGDDIILLNADNRFVFANGGNDTIIQTETAQHNHGGSGEDTVSYSSSDAAVEVNLQTGTGSGGFAEGDSYESIERVVGSDFDDVLIGNDEDNQLLGGRGDDQLISGGGADFLDGGLGKDTANYSSSEQAVSVHLAQQVNGEERSGFGYGGDAQADTLSGIEALVGSDQADTFVGNDEDNELLGARGDDYLAAAGGDDQLMGGNGNDQLLGGEGNDHLHGGNGDDLVLGGSGDDLIHTGSGNDVVLAGAGDDWIEVDKHHRPAESSQLKPGNAIEYKQIDGGAGIDTVKLDGQLSDYTVSEWGTGYRLQSDQQTINLNEVEQVVFSQNDSSTELNQPIKMEHLVHLKLAQQMQREEEQETKSPLRVSSTAGALTGTVLAGLFANAAASEAVDMELDNTQSELASSWNHSGSNRSEDDPLSELTDGLASIEAATDNLPSEAERSDDDPDDTPFAKLRTPVNTSNDSFQSKHFSDRVSEQHRHEKLSAQDAQDRSSNEKSIEEVLDSDSSKSRYSSSQIPPELGEQTTLNDAGSTYFNFNEPASGEDGVAQHSHQASYALAPELKIANLEVLEDGAIPLNIQVIGNNRNETIRVYVEGIPKEANLNVGLLQPDGRWLIPHSQLDQAVIYPSPNDDQDMQLKVIAVSVNVDSGLVTSSEEHMNIAVHAVADKPTLTVSEARGNEDTAIALNIQTHLHDQDGSETQQIIISGLPHGSMLNQGRLQADGSWKLLPACN